MSDDLPPDLDSELLDDFYSEADEHLAAIRHELSALEKSASASGASIADSPHLRSLFASFHSFKGISALAGLAQAERLAHSAEDYLRLLSEKKKGMEKAGLDTLMHGARALEQTVAAHRAGKALPDASGILEKLSALSDKKEKPADSPSPSSPKATPAPEITSVAEARQQGLLVWQAVFTPNKENDKRGVNINSVRERLAALGEILQAKPEVGPDKNIEFHFLLALREPPQDLKTWEADGIRFEPSNDPRGASTAPEPDEGTSAHDPFVAPSRLVRVDIARLDDLMRVMGDLVTHRARLDEQINRLSRRTGDEAEDLKEAENSLGRSLNELREVIVRVRLVPVVQLFERIPFVVRDLAGDSGKQVSVALSGQETEIDKFIIERLKDPLLHLVRNAVSHGIEDPGEREKLGKNPEATISLSAETAGDSVIVRIQDDGRGIDSKRVAQRAVARGFSVPARLGGPELLTLLCKPGFSTREDADRASGRGVGMTVAYDTVRALGGTMSLDTEKTKGSAFTLRLPITLAIADVFIVQVGANRYAVPQSAIAEVIELDTAGLRKVGRTELLHYRNGVLPLVRLAAVFRTEPNAARQHVVVTETERGLSGLVVDAVISQREVVVRSLGDPLSQAEGIAGATELGDGRPILILDVAALTRGATRPRNAKTLPKTPSQMKQNS